MNYEELMDVVFPSDELTHYGIPQTPDGKGSGRYKKDFSPKKDAKRLRKELNKQDFKVAWSRRNLEGYTANFKKADKKYKKLKNKYGEDHKKTIKTKELRDTLKSKIKDEVAKYDEGRTLLNALVLEGQMKGYKVLSRPLGNNGLVVMPHDPFTAAAWTGYYIIRDVLLNKPYRNKYYVKVPDPDKGTK